MQITKPTHTTANNYFYEGADLDAMSNTNNYYSWLIDLIQKDVTGSILEVGAGSGNFSKVLLNNFPESNLTSIEPSTEMFSILNSKFQSNPNISIFNASLDSIADQKYDTIIYNNVLEHIEDDLKELKLAHSMLNNGGKIILYSPAMPILMSRFDRSIGHYRRYTREDKVSKAVNAGFRVTKKHYVDFPGFFAWLLAIKMMNIKVEEGNASSYDKYVVPLLRKFDPSKYLNFGKNILVIAAKD
jgi:2-polyprenyl-3-methyl-5-hydroxy-6-metoxy-1,4-benzoquinol methylase